MILKKTHRMLKKVWCLKCPISTLTYLFSIRAVFSICREREREKDRDRDTEADRDRDRDRDRQRKRGKMKEGRENIKNKR